MENHDTTYSSERFIQYLETLNSNDQKRMLFMIEAKLTLYNDSKYNTDFGIYPDYQNLFFNKMIATTFYQFFFRVYFNLLDKKLFPTDVALDKWNNLKAKIFKELSLKNQIFENEYELFKFGIKLKALRNTSKRKFSEKCGLSILKITQIEESGFLSKIADVKVYLEKGFEKKLILEIE